MTIVISNLKRIFKTKSNFIIMFIVPMVFITVSMLGSFGGEAKTMLGIVDNDKTKFTQIFIDNLKEKNDVVFLEEKDIKTRLVSLSIDYGMVIDKGFTSKVINNQEANLKGYSIKESNMSLPTKFFMDSFLNSARNIGAASKGNETEFYRGLNNYSKGAFAAEYKRTIGTNTKATSTLAGLGFLVMSMLLISTMTASIILDDKKNKTFYRIFAGPISTRNYMLQNVLSFFLTLVIQLVVIFAIMIFGFKAFFGASVLNMGVLFMIFGLVCVSLGVAISSMCRDTRQAGALSSFIIVPMCMLGGCYWPRSFMPDILIRIGEFLPTTWVMKAAGKLIDGGRITSIFTDVAVLLLFAIIFVLLGAWKKADVTN